MSSGVYQHKQISEETRRKMSIARKKNPTKYWLGKKLSEETCKKMSLGKMGEKNRRWKGGITTPEHRKDLTRKWRKENYDRVLYLNLKRRSRKSNADGSHTFGDWETLKAQYNFTCPCCGKSEPEITLSEDHIIPLSRGGSDNIENIQPLCGCCNSKKHTQTIKYEIPSKI